MGADVHNLKKRIALFFACLLVAVGLAIGLVKTGDILASWFTLTLAAVSLLALVVGCFLAAKRRAG